MQVQWECDGDMASIDCADCMAEEGPERGTMSDLWGDKFPSWELDELWIEQCTREGSHIPEFDQVQPQPQITWTTWFTLGAISGYLDYPWSLTSVPPQISRISRTIQSLRLSMTFYRLSHLDSIILLSCHSLNLTCTRLALRDPVSTPLGSCTSPLLGLVLSPSTTLSVFGHCLCIILYKPGLCSTSTLVQISCRVLVLSPHHHISVFIPMPSKFHLSSWLLHSTFLSAPPKSISDLELWLELYLLSSPVIDHHLVVTPSLPDLSLSVLSTNLPYYPWTLGVSLDWLSVTSSVHRPFIPLW